MLLLLYYFTISKENNKITKLWNKSKHLKQYYYLIKDKNIYETKFFHYFV